MKEPKKVQLAHLFDATRCIGCSACIVSCLETNHPEVIDTDIPGKGWLGANIRRVILEHGRPIQLLIQCQQCSDAPCVNTCPFGANYYDDNGLVRNDPNRCIGCNYCIASCPYDCRWSNPVNGLPSKCMGEGCLDLIKNGIQPACVAACPVSARLFGNTLDPNSEISQKIATTKTRTLLESHGTKPNFYVVI